MDSEKTRPPAGSGNRVLSDRYRITQLLGVGGMAKVYLAYDEKLEIDVAIKIPDRTLLREPGFRDRFVAETRSLLRLRHPNILNVVDVGEDGGVPFAVMDYLSGGSINDQRFVDEEGNFLPIMPAYFDRWLNRISEALDFIHRKGYVHRDIKPDNILLDADGNAYLSDFGIAKAYGDAQSSQAGNLTRTGMLVGTPEYVAPEISLGQTYDGRSDQYSLAVMVFELLAGSRPFAGTTPAAIVLNQSQNRVSHVERIESFWGDAVSSVVLKGLAIEPDARYGTCVEFENSLAKAFAVVPHDDIDRPVTTRCPTCAAAIKVDPRWAGKFATCNRCSERIQIQSTGYVVAANVPTPLGTKVSPGTPSPPSATNQPTIPPSETSARFRPIPTAVTAVGVLVLTMMLWYLLAKETEVKAPTQHASIQLDAGQNLEAVSPADLTTQETRENSKPIDASPEPVVELQPTDPTVVDLDMQQASDTASTSTEPPIPSPPPALEILPIPNQNISYREGLDLQIQTSTPLSPGMIFTLAGDFPEGMTINEATGRVHWLPTKDQVATQQTIGIEVQVENASSPLATAKFAIQVADLRPEIELPSEFTNSVGMNMKLIPAGSFEMGCKLTREQIKLLFDVDWSSASHDRPVHTVEITQPFFMGATEVTQGQWKKVMGTEPWEGVSQSSMISSHVTRVGPEYPAHGVTWNEAVEFCNKLSGLDGMNYGIPTEAMWEFACRGGTTTVFSFGDSPTLADDYAWIIPMESGMGKSLSEYFIHEVGKSKPNKFGLFDMHGNVGEWCNDWYAEDYYLKSPRRDPTGATTGTGKVLRGGDVDSQHVFATSSFRSAQVPTERYPLTGFRVVAMPVEEESQASGIEFFHNERTLFVGDQQGGDTTVCATEKLVEDAGVQDHLVIHTNAPIETRHAYLKFDLHATLRNAFSRWSSKKVDQATLVLTVDQPRSDNEDVLQVYGSDSRGQLYWLESGPQALVWKNSPSAAGINRLEMVAETTVPRSLKPGDKIEISSPRLAELIKDTEANSITLVLAMKGRSLPLSIASHENSEYQEPAIALKLSHDNSAEAGDDEHDENPKTQIAEANLPKRFKNSVGMDFALISSGDFVMGSPESEPNRKLDEQQHRVVITQPFYISQTEVTQRQWLTVMKDKPYGSMPIDASTLDSPIWHVDYRDARGFCIQLSAKEGRPYDLPSEAQWEYACRGGSDTMFSFGNRDKLLGQYCQFRPTYTTPVNSVPFAVGQKEPNPFGLFDMHGNVWEWCLDGYQSNFSDLATTTDPVGRSDEKGVLRGGSFLRLASECRSASRRAVQFSEKDETIGFRVILKANSSDSVIEHFINRAGDSAESTTTAVRTKPKVRRTRRANLPEQLMMEIPELAD
jgi:formylglycine-generating enzyme required for sulfatase activity/serine/threonine protein kinase